MNNDDQDTQLQQLLTMLAQEENQSQKKFTDNTPKIITTTNTQEIEIVLPSEDTKSPKVHKKKGRCQLCNKKLPLALQFECRCGFNYCGIHRSTESHQCTFDYKTYDRKILEERNQRVVADKLERI